MIDLTIKYAAISILSSCFEIYYSTKRFQAEISFIDTSLLSHLLIILPVKVISFSDTLLYIKKE